jgi:hypothetical protein
MPHEQLHLPDKLLVYEALSYMPHKQLHLPDKLLVYEALSY